MSRKGIKTKKIQKGLPVWVYKAKLESDWLLYTGSNTQLNEDIKNGDRFEKVIWAVSNCEKKLSFLGDRGSIQDGCY